MSCFYQLKPKSFIFFCSLVTQNPHIYCTYKIPKERAVKPLQAPLASGTPSRVLAALALSTLTPRAPPAHGLCRVTTASALPPPCPAPLLTAARPQHEVGGGGGHPSAPLHSPPQLITFPKTIFILICFSFPTPKLEDWQIVFLSSEANSMHLKLVLCLDLISCSFLPLAQTSLE